MYAKRAAQIRVGLLYKGVSDACRKLLAEEDRERAVRSGPVKMRQGQKPARTFATAEFEEEDKSRGEYITNQERGKRSRDEVREHFSPGDWICGICRTPVPKNTFKCTHFGHPSQWRLEKTHPLYKCPYWMQSQCEGTKEKCYKIGPGNVLTVNMFKSKKKQSRTTKGTSLGLESWRLSMHRTSLADTGETLVDRHLALCVAEAGGPQDELKETAKGRLEECLRYAKTGLNFGTQMTAGEYPLQPGQWVCSSCHNKVLKDETEEGGIVRADMINEAKDRKCKQCDTPKPRANGGTGELRWICRSATCYDAVTEDTRQLCTYRQGRDMKRL